MNEIVNFIIVNAIAAPDAGTVEIIETKALRPGHKRLQKPLCGPYVFSSYQVVYIRRHGLFRLRSAATKWLNAMRIDCHEARGIAVTGVSARW